MRTWKRVKKREVASAEGEQLLARKVRRGKGLFVVEQTGMQNGRAAVHEARE